MKHPPKPSTGMEVLAGFVDRVTFHNAENGFCVLRVKARGQRDPITVVGHAAVISAGEFVQASGLWTNGNAALNSTPFVRWRHPLAKARLRRPESPLVLSLFSRKERS